jgi:hypothetical protein
MILKKKMRITEEKRMRKRMKKTFLKMDLLVLKILTIQDGRQKHHLLQLPRHLKTLQISLSHSKTIKIKLRSSYKMLKIN